MPWLCSGESCCAANALCPGFPDLLPEESKTLSFAGCYRTGNPEPKLIAPGADITCDLPKYRVYEKGELKGEFTDIKDYWTKDMMGFLLGCSFTFEKALIGAGIPVRHIEEKHNVPCISLT